MIEKVEFCSAEIMADRFSPNRLLSMQNQVEKWLEIPHFCCHFYIFQNVAAKHVLNHWFIDDYTPQTLFFMEKHCSTISFWLKNRTDKNGKSPIIMVIAANGERAEFQTGKKIEVVNWDNGKQQAKGKITEAKLLNGYLNQLRNKVYLKEIELMQRGPLITARLLRDAVIDKAEALFVNLAV